jgi:hypothetical protein
MVSWWIERNALDCGPWWIDIFLFQYRNQQLFQTKNISLSFFELGGFSIG